MNPNNQDEARAPLLTREQLRHELNARGYPLSASYFAKLCLPSKGGGPPVDRKFGKRPLYRLEDGIAWAESRCCRPATAA
jgi:hypothetical protein